MTTFALVHGSWHGAWCWDHVVPELEALGHRAIAVDLPSDDVAATFETYADVVVDALKDLPSAGEVVVVGHSMGGHTIPLVAARRPVGRLVYLCAIVPMPGRSYREQVRVEPDTMLPEYKSGLEVRDGATYWIDEDVATAVFYGDCDISVAHAAFQRLRPQSNTPLGIPCPLAALPETPSTYVVCTEDRIVNPRRARAVVGARLDAAIVELPGDHSPMLSRPHELAEVLDSVSK